MKFNHFFRVHVTKDVLIGCRRDNCTQCNRVVVSKQTESIMVTPTHITVLFLAIVTPPLGSFVVTRVTQSFHLVSHVRMFQNPLHERDWSNSALSRKLATQDAHVSGDVIDYFLFEAWNAELAAEVEALECVRIGE